MLITASLFAVYIVLGMLSAKLRSSGHDPPHPSFRHSWRALLSLGVRLRHYDDRHHRPADADRRSVQKNGVMLVDFAIERRWAAMSPRAAIEEAAILRFRPILMTTLAAVFVTMPIAVGVSAGFDCVAPWRRCRRQIARFATLDALHDASDVSLHGAVAQFDRPKCP